jgi:hypothetical protein
MKNPFRGTQDRRCFPRYTFEVLSWVYTDSDQPPKKIVGRISNISAKGAFLHTAERLPENTLVRVEIFLMDTQEALEQSKKIEVIQATGKIVRIDPDGMAISFHEDFETRLSSIEEISSSAL